MQLCTNQSNKRLTMSIIDLFLIIIKMQDNQDIQVIPGKVIQVKKERIIKVNPFSTNEQQNIQSKEQLLFQEECESSSRSSIQQQKQKESQLLYENEEYNKKQHKKSLSRYSQAIESHAKGNKTEYQIQQKPQRIKKNNQNIKFLSQHEIYISEQQSSQSQQQKGEPLPFLLKSTNIKDIIMRPIPKHQMLECVVKVESSIWQKHTKIELYLKEQKKLLLYGIKNKINLASYFEIKSNNSVKENQTYGYIHSNYTRREYKLLRFNKNSEKDRKESEKIISHLDEYSQSIIKLNPVEINDVSIYESGELAYMAYQPNLFGMKQQKAMVLLAKKRIFESQRFSDLKACYEKKDHDKLSIYSNKMAQKNKEGKLTLDFKAEKVMFSPNNMIIQSEYGEACVSCYKYKENVYMLNIMEPFNIICGFFIAISNIDKQFL